MTKLTKSTFDLIAAAIADARAEIIEKEPHELQRDLLDGTAYAAEFVAHALAPTNPQFDLERFLKACGVQS